MADEITEAVNDIKFYLDRLEERNKELEAALDELLCEAEDVFNCMADATGIDRHNYPQPYIKARAALGEKKDG